MSPAAPVGSTPAGAPAGAPGMRWGFILGLVDDDVVRKRHLRTHFALGIVSKHDLDHNTENTLPHQHISCRMADVVPLGLTCGDEVAIAELHDLGSLCTQLS